MQHITISSSRFWLTRNLCRSCVIICYQIDKDNAEDTETFIFDNDGFVIRSDNDDGLVAPIDTIVVNEDVNNLFRDDE